MVTHFTTIWLRVNGYVGAIQERRMRENVIAIEGTSNLRDIGGYPTKGGGRLLRGLVYRSEALVFSGALTKASIYREDNAHAYKQIGIRTVVDLRGQQEVDASPSAWPLATGAELIAFPMDAGGEGDATVVMNLLRQGKLRSFSVADLARFYGAMARKLAPMFGGALNALGQPGRLPALVHCAAGKDRTGMFVAFLMEALDVPRQHVLSDYAFTDVLRPNRVQHYRELLDKAGIEPDAVRSLFEAPAEALQGALENLETEYGDVQSFLTRAAGVAPESLRRLREQLIEEAA
jgi:protein-tyrosine phosphatase